VTSELVPLTEPGRWRSALDQVPHAFAHTWGNSHAMQLTSGWPTFLYVYSQAGCRVVCPLSIRGDAGDQDVLTPYGFSGFAGFGDATNFPAHWAEFARSQGWVCGYIGLHPTLDSSRYSLPEDRYPSGIGYTIDLTSTEEELFSRLSTNRQRQVRAWQDGDATLTTDRDRLATFFRDNLETFLSVRRAAQVYYLSAATIDALFSLKDVLVLGAERDEKIEAVSVFGSTPHVGDFLFNVSLPAGRAHSAPLIWLAILELRAAGVPRLHLGGGITAGDGVAEFKSRFGSHELPLNKLKQVYRPEAFVGLCIEAGVDPLSRSGYFPPYRGR
jgi:hypothetical protein